MKKQIGILLLFLAVMFAGVSPVSAADRPELSDTTLGMNIYGLSRTAEGYYYTSNHSVTISGLSESTEVICKSSSSDLLVERGWSTGEYFFYPKKAGEYKVTFSMNGLSLSCKVYVVKANLRFARSSKSLNDEIGKSWVEGYTTLCLYPGEKETLKLKGTDGVSKVKWTSSDKSIATVNKNGTVTAKRYGYADIMASYKGITLTYRMEVTYKDSALALRYAAKNYHSAYSQSNRMSSGSYDCSSYVWRSFASVKHYLGGTTSYAPTAAELARWCVDKGYTVIDGAMDSAKLLPGDLVFQTGEDNGRYRGIYHVDFYTGYGMRMTVARSKEYEEYGTVIAVRPCIGAPAAPSVRQDVFSNYVSWTEGRSYGASSYRVYRSESANGTFTSLKLVKGRNDYYDTSAVKGKTYYYKIRPYWTSSRTISGVQGSASKGVKTAVGTPEALELVNTAGGVKLTWPKVAGATEYKVYRRKGSKKTLLATVAGTEKRSLTDANVNDGMTCQYTVRAYKEKTASKYAQDSSIVFYAPPQISTITTASGGLQLKWSKVSGVSYYRLYRKRSGGSWGFLAEVKGGSYLDTDVESGSKYLYALQCIKKNGQNLSAWQKNTDKYLYVEP